MAFLTGKRALITGIASNRSIAWGVAQVMARQGAELAFTYQGDKLKGRVTDMAAELGSDICLPMDVTDDAQIESVFAQLGQHWETVDSIVHSIGFAPREQLTGRYLDTVTREGFRIAQDISSYSFVALAKASLEANVRFMAADLGPDGIRVNGISAGPIKTLAAAGIGGLRDMLHYMAKAAPLRRNVTIDDVGNAAAFLCSDLAAGITGEILYVDAGYSTVGMSMENLR